MSPLHAGLSMLPVGVLVAALSPAVGRFVGTRGPRLPLLVAGSALVLGGCMSLLLGSSTPLPGVLASFLAFGVFLACVNPPITNTAVAGMPRAMAGVAASVVSTGRQVGVTIGVAISGTIVGSAVGRGGPAFVRTAHGVWWLVLGLGVGIVALGLLGTGRWASRTATRAAESFETLS
ncbi:Major Facilitator Superfamily protein [Actinopolymorpha cephalotaxi]|uniref:MFS family permease n=1 Tax=Actinopolymorpha cephalotaxi TaxID=504797 RepID=A0A1I3AQ62_9ACTN|nr:MFS transporter [Actinopolymorpha cephalotaxi]NYH86009.1 MFS family permease [Actinopolymorpha cephalotaxi]SFH52205.1 Major Facilitator Superfamily protein [Actinopolymorpha cephalotaxi]